MIALPLQQPTPPVVITQQPVQGIRTQNLKVRPVPLPSQIFQTKALKSSTIGVNPRLNSSQVLAKDSSNLTNTSQSALDKNTSQSTVSTQTQPTTPNTVTDTAQSPQQGQNSGQNGESASGGGSEQSNAEAEKQQSEQRSKQQVEKAQLVEEQQIISSLSSRDRVVRAHEQAHSSVGGSLAGAPSFTFTRGPNGVLYATAGEVSISTGTAGSSDPQVNIAKLEKVIRAALAPAQPSGQDLKVAASASASLNALNSSVAAQKRDEALNKSSDGSSSSSSSSSSKLKSNESTNADSLTNNANSVQSNLSSLRDSNFKQNLENRILKSGALNVTEKPPILRLTA